MNKVGLGSRVINFLVDTAIIFIITYIVNSVWVFYALYYHVFYLQFSYIFLLVQFVYYFFFELIFSRTPGKWLSYSRVVNKTGGRPAFLQILLRSLTRLLPIDCFFIPFVENTLHDYISKTEVAEV
ncbi:MAG: RDD family protein [Panacibacter sp.]